MISNSLSADARQQANVYDKIGEKYEAIFGNNTNQTTAVKWLLDRLPPNSKILDIGSGTGVPTARMLADAGHTVTGIDISVEMVKIAQHQVPQGTFFQADAANLSFAPASFHAVTAFFSLLMLRRANIESTLRQIKTILKSPGYLVLGMVEGDFDYYEAEFLGQPVHVSAYPRDVLASHLKDLSFTILDNHFVKFQANKQTPPETQLFFFCQNQA
ncbi:unnamed protein product [Didymodactylos carnosus]|uniref:Methyltransferase domain-containing protein n=1 Tax=Didymodactylos carnosus TaxID=1234261 RepID=A0A815VIH7_9BILA|nr:unnamed protein product [Didymodactylos carnosus]CAF4392859.1 unnamed protein product [Didymodactylos carnosus]